MFYGVFILVAAVGLVWLAIRRPHRRRWLLPRRAAAHATVAAVDRQHRHLRAGGLIGESACEKTKDHFRTLLAAGRADRVEDELRPGLEFAVQVQALTELGSTDAVRVLERQLTRPLTGDPIEQTWYWVDVAAGLRLLRRGEALPAVLRCADATAGLPAGAMLAAEAVAFPNFLTAIKQPGSLIGRMALRALVSTSRATRDGLLDPGSLLRAGLGDVLAEAAARADADADPWHAMAVIETERVFRRLGHWARVLPSQVRGHAERQAMRLWATGDHRCAWLAGSANRLRARFPAAGGEEQGAILRCLTELRADVTALFPHLPDRRSPWWTDAVRALRWSKSPVVGPVLAGQAVRLTRKTRTHGRAATILSALRGHACHETERVLLRSVGATNPALRHAAVGSLGWWAPFDPDRVVRALRAARTDPDHEVRQSAVSALARLGERAALAEVTAGLQSEEPAIRADTATRIAAEELTWLWPDLETAAAVDDTDTVLAACEALERLREGMFGFAA